MVRRDGYGSAAHHGAQDGGRQRRRRHELRTTTHSAQVIVTRTGRDSPCRLRQSKREARGAQRVERGPAESDAPLACLGLQSSKGQNLRMVPSLAAGAGTGVPLFSRRLEQGCAGQAFARSSGNLPFAGRFHPLRRSGIMVTRNHSASKLRARFDGMVTSTTP